MSINKVILTGNLTRDAELRYSQNGTPISNIGIAVNDPVKNSTTGEWENYANYVNCTMFGKRAEALDQYLKKGQKVAIEGKLHFSSWESEGQKKSKLEVIINNLELCGPKRNASQQGNDEAVTIEPRIEDFGLSTEDIPF